MTKSEIEQLTQHVIATIKQDYILLEKNPDLGEKNARVRDQNNFMQIILTEVCRYFDVPQSSLTIKSRRHQVANIRHMFFKLSRDLSNKEISYSTMGKFMGGRDHCTALHGDVTATSLIRIDKDFKFDFEMIKKSLDKSMGN